MRIRTAVAACCVLGALGVSCSSNDTPSMPIVTGTVADTPAGDRCTDGTGDLLVDETDTGVARSEPAGIDLVSAAADLGDDTLSLRFETVAPVESAPDATFYVQHGDLVQSPSLSWELRIERSNAGAWVVKLITVPKVGREVETTLTAAPSIEGNAVSVTLQRADLPSISSRIWSFGSSAGISSENRVFDECLPYAGQSEPGSTAAVGSTTVTAAPVRGTVGQTLAGPDGSEVTVHAVEVPAVPEPGFEPTPVAGTQFVAADVEVCASDRELDDVGETRFVITLANGDTRDIVALPQSPHEPRFPASQSLRPGECARGWVTFQVAADTGVVSVAYDVSGVGVGPLLIFTA